MDFLFLESRVRKASRKNIRESIGDKAKLPAG